MRLALGFLFLSACSVWACSTNPPPTPPGVDASVAPLPAPHAATTDDAAAPAPVASASASESAGPSDAAAPAVAVNAPDAGDPGTLPQTKDKPAATSPALDQRAAALWDAIAHDDPDRGMPFFFPVSAYKQVKDVGNPAGDWRLRLVAAYKRDIHGLAKRLGSNADRAKLVRLDVQDDRAKWVEPNEEYNKIGYYRVFGTKIVYEIDGKERSMEISSLISWRGEWYVVHLTGFK